MKKHAVKIDPLDNVAVVSQPLGREEEVRVNETGQVLRALDAIDLGHKIALVDIAAGEMIIKYGIPIGRASDDIRFGQWVHCHNVEDITEEICREQAEIIRKGGSLRG